MVRRIGFLPFEGSGIYHCGTEAASPEA
jgi:hypothetical protein